MSEGRLESNESKRSDKLEALMMPIGCCVKTEFDVKCLTVKTTTTKQKKKNKKQKPETTATKNIPI